MGAGCVTGGPNQYADGRPESIQRGEILTRDHVLHAALDMIDAEGVEALSMRKLGQALNRDPMRVYSHTESKAALLDAVAELVLENFVVPSASDGDWEDALRAAAHSFRDIAVAHPHMVPLLVTRPMSTPWSLLAPASLRWLEELLVLLTEAGFDDSGALYAYRFFTGFLAGHVLHEIQERHDDSGRSEKGFGSTVKKLPSKQFPRIGALAPALATYDGELEMVLGLDIVLGGLRSQLDATTHPSHLSK